MPVVISKVLPLKVPLIVWIDPTNICNFKCTFCPTGDDQLLKSVSRPKGMMKLEVFEKTINDLSLKARGKHGNYILIKFENEKIANNVVNFLKKKLIYVKGPYKDPWKKCIGVSIGIKEQMKPFILAMKEAKGSIF